MAARKKPLVDAVSEVAHFPLTHLAGVDLTMMSAKGNMLLALIEPAIPTVGKFMSSPSVRALQLWETMIAPQAKQWKRRGNACKSCSVEFIPHPDNPDADVCGLCKARKKEFDAMLQCLTLRVAK